MKISVFFASLLILTTFVLVSCGKEDPIPDPDKVTVNFPVDYAVVGAAGSSGIKISTTVNLSDLLSKSGNQDKVKYVKAGLVSPKSTIKFTGVTGTGAILSNITFSTDDNVIKDVKLINSFSNQPLTLSKDTILEMGEASYFKFLGDVSSYIATKKSIKLNAKYDISNSNITSGKMTLDITSTFGW